MIDLTENHWIENSQCKLIQLLSLWASALEWANFKLMRQVSANFSHAQINGQRLEHPQRRPSTTTMKAHLPQLTHSVNEASFWFTCAMWSNSKGRKKAPQDSARLIYSYFCYVILQGFMIASTRRKAASWGNLKAAIFKATSCRPCHPYPHHPWLGRRL